MSARAYTPEQEAIIAEKFANGACLAELRREYGGAYPAIRGALVRQGVYVSRPGGYYGHGGAPRRALSDAEMARAVTLWNEGKSATFIGSDLGVWPNVVRRALRGRGVPVVDRPHAVRGAEHGHWKGGRTLRDGYVFVLIERGDPYGVMCNKLGYAAEHRLVMAHSLGRPLLRTESVHHINGIRDDNRLENLQLRQGQHGNGVVMQCLDCGSHNVNSRPITGS